MVMVADVAFAPELTLTKPLALLGTGKLFVILAYFSMRSVINQFLAKLW
jgi:hypothetical protein